MDNLTKYIGIPFKYGGRTHDELDCYGLVMLLYKELYGMEVPDVTSPTFIKDIHDLVASEKLKWTPCELEEGAVIIFNIKGYGSHVGMYIGDDYMIHTWEATGGVTIERVGINWKHRILGVYKWTQNKQ
jgi:cell wall-associated NlpC family hydrolase